MLSVMIQKLLQLLPAFNKPQVSLLLEAVCLYFGFSGDI